MTIGTGLNYEGAVKPSSVEKDAYEAPLYASRYTEIPSNMQMRCDYDVRTDAQPVYLGFAAKGLAAGTAGWLIHKYTYDVSDRPTLRQVAYHNWTDRTNGSYS